MVETKIVSIKELTDKNENPTLCLSPLRVFNKCHECEVFKRAQDQNRTDKLRCKPHLNPKYHQLEQEKRKALDELARIEKEIKKL